MFLKKACASLLVLPGLLSCSAQPAAPFEDLGTASSAQESKANVFIDAFIHQNRQVIYFVGQNLEATDYICNMRVPVRYADESGQEIGIRTVYALNQTLRARELSFMLEAGEDLIRALGQTFRNPKIVGLAGPVVQECTSALPPSDAEFARALWPMPSPPTSYTASTDTVRDNVTGLVWQRTAPTGSFTFEEAKAYCKNLVLGGTGGWRLPYRIELTSLVDFTRTYPAMDSAAFPDAANAMFWSASACPEELGGRPMAWGFYDRYGDVQARSTADKMRARCVQSSPTPRVTQRYTERDGIVTDNFTKLQWKQAIPSSEMNWEQAKAYCENLNLNGVGWRLPNMKEIQTLLDEAKKNPMIDEAAFPNTPTNEAFWTSTVYQRQGNQNYALSFRDGALSQQMTIPQNDLWVRCVR